MTRRSRKPPHGWRTVPCSKTPFIVDGALYEKLVSEQNELTVWYRKEWALYARDHVTDVRVFSYVLTTLCNTGYADRHAYGKTYCHVRLKPGLGKLKLCTILNASSVAEKSCLL